MEAHIQDRYEGMDSGKDGCGLLNERIGKRVFRVRSTDLKRDDVRELIEEAAEKVMEFA
ncbi:MAG: hypothetical protein ACTSV0_06390 [Candidatus Freyarchaeota archaeon]